MQALPLTAKSGLLEVKSVAMPCHALRSGGRHPDVLVKQDGKFNHEKDITVMQAHTRM